MPRLLLYTAAGYTNLGDDAILEGALQVLRGAVPDAEFAVAGGAALAPRANQLGVTAIDAYDWEAVASAVGASDAVLLGGGGLLYDHTFAPTWEDWARGHAAWLYQAPRLAIVAKAFGKPFGLFSLGVGPLETPIGRAFARYTAQQAGLVIVRDRGSADILAQMGADRVPAQVIPDVAAAAPGPAALDVGAFGTRPRPWIAVNVRPWRDGERVHAAVADAVAEVLQRTGGSALLLPFQRTPDDDAAVARTVARTVAERIGRPDRVAVAAPGSPQAAMAMLAAADVALVMRLHALWFAVRAGVPSVVLVYDPKVAALAGVFVRGIEAVPLAIADGEMLARAVLRLLDQRDALVSELRAVAGSLAAQAPRAGQAVAAWLRAPRTAPRAGDDRTPALELPAEVVWPQVASLAPVRAALARETHALYAEVRRPA